LRYARECIRSRDVKAANAIFVVIKSCERNLLRGVELAVFASRLWVQSFHLQRSAACGAASGSVHKCPEATLFPANATVEMLLLSPFWESCIECLPPKLALLRHETTHAMDLSSLTWTLRNGSTKIDPRRVLRREEGQAGT
jgi:hypothetical protein